MALREVTALIGLGTLGGLWAVAMGQRHSRRPERSAMLDARTQIQARLDAVRARVAELARTATTAEPSNLLDEVVELQVLVDAILRRAAHPDEVRELDDQIEAMLLLLEAAAELEGLRMPADAPFAGLCAVDPRHGAGTTSETLDAEPREVCAACAQAIRAGDAPTRRQVTRDGRPVPFDTA